MSFDFRNSPDILAQVLRRAHNFVCHHGATKAAKKQDFTAVMRSMRIS